jgi:hypothetical protein
VSLQQTDRGTDMPSLAIIAMCILAAIVYGVIHDQITARICVEYFTIGHPDFFHTDDPTFLGFAWGALATWWVGLILGILLACAARAGTPKRSVVSLIRPVAILMAATALCALIAGYVGWYLAHEGYVGLFGPLRRRIPEDRHPAFIADLWAHNASYLAGFFFSVILMIHVWRSRRR